MKSILTISIFLLSSICIGQKTTISVKQDSIKGNYELNGLYASNTFIREFKDKGRDIKMKEMLFMEYDFGFIRMIQLRISKERALELYEKKRLFNPKLTIVFAEISEKDSVNHSIEYQNIDSSFQESSFVEFSYNEKLKYKANVDSSTRKPTIVIPAYISRDVPKITKRNMILIGESDYYHTVEQLVFTKL